MTHQIFTVRARLVAVFAALTLLLLLVAGLAVIALKDSQSNFENYIEGAQARAALADEVRSAVDRRAVAARNLVLVSKVADLEAEKTEVAKAHADVGAHLGKLQQLAKSAEVSSDARNLIAELARIESLYAPVALSIIDLAVTKQTDQAIVKMNDECRPLLAALKKVVNDYMTYTQAQGQSLVTEARVQYERERNYLLAACVLAFATAITAALLIPRSLARALGAEPAVLGAAARKVAEGDLSTITGAEQAPAGSVMASLGAMQANLASLVDRVRLASDSIATGSSEIAIGNADLSQRTEEQASALQQTSATMDELSVTVRNNADNAAQANGLAKSASEVQPFALESMTGYFRLNTATAPTSWVA